MGKKVFFNKKKRFLSRILTSKPEFSISQLIIINILDDQSTTNCRGKFPLILPFMKKLFCILILDIDSRLYLNKWKIAFVLTRYGYFANKLIICFRMIMKWWNNNQWWKNNQWMQFEFMSIDRFHIRTLYAFLTFRIIMVYVWSM